MYIIYYNCHYSHKKIIFCTAQCRDGELRLRDGSTQFIGRVEICFSQQWGTVLDLTWSQEEANVACGQLGYSNSGQFRRDCGYELFMYCPYYYLRDRVQISDVLDTNAFLII